MKPQCVACTMWFCEHVKCPVCHLFFCPRCYKFHERTHVMNKLPCDYAACDGTINGEECPQKATCLRHVGVQPECHRQAWVRVTDQEIGECKCYMEVRG